MAFLTSYIVIYCLDNIPVELKQWPCCYITCNNLERKLSEM